MTESEVECFSGVKTVQNSKKEGGIKREKKDENVKLKEDVPGAILLREKPQECKSSQFNFNFFYSRWIRLAFGIP